MLKFWVGHEDHEGPQRARRFVEENHSFKNLKYQEGALLTRKFKVIAKHWSAACCFFFVHVVVLRGSASSGPRDPLSHLFSVSNFGNNLSSITCLKICLGKAPF